jgi:predicted dehydrogenase
MSLQIAVIGGTGHIHYVAVGLRELPDARLTAIAPGCPEEDGPAIAARMKANDAVRLYDDYRKLLERETPDIVAVAPFY